MLHKREKNWGVFSASMIRTSVMKKYTLCLCQAVLSHCVLSLFAVQLHQREVPVYSLPYLWSHVLLCLGGRVHWCPCCVHRSLVVRDMSPCCPAQSPFFLCYGMTPTDCCLHLSFLLVVRGYVVYWWVWAVSGGYSRADVPQSHPGAGLPASRHG